MVIWKRGWVVFEEDRSPRMVDGRRRTTKAGGSEEGLGYSLRLESEFEKRERAWWLSSRRASHVFMSLGRSLYVQVRSLQADLASYPQVRALEAPCKINDITCANELQNINGR
jgi:hypothetical protein